jgi:antitoxin MazE
MQVRVIKIGNSKGIRLSKTILQKYDIQDNVELILEDEQIVVKPSSKVRSGWDAAFRKMHLEGDDQLLIDDVFADEDI